MSAPALRHVAGAAAPPAGDYDADVVILALDRIEETEAAIGSALAQAGIARHVVVVDQGSRPENLARLAHAVHGRADATLLASAANLGVPGGRNAGSAFGHGRSIVAIDNDAAFDDATVLARAHAVLAADAGLAAIGFRVVVDATGEDDIGSWGYPASLLPQSRGAFDAVTFVGAGHAIRRAAWRQAGGYDAALFFAWEEFDFCLRAIHLGWRVRYRGDLVVRHKVSPERRVTWTGDRWFYVVRNRLYIARKWGMGWHHVAPRFAAYLVKGLCNGTGWQTVRALASTVRLSRGIRAARLDAAARAYIAANDAAHRGSWLDRLRREVLVRLPGREAGGRVAARAREAAIR